MGVGECRDKFTGSCASPRLQPEEKSVTAAMSVKEPRRRKRYAAQKRTKSRRQYAEDVKNCELRYRQ